MRPSPCRSQGRARILLPLLSVLLPLPFSSLSAQGDLGGPEFLAEIEREGREGSRALSMYAHLTDAIGPRLSGTPAFKEAADWARGLLMEWGLANARLEDWDFGRGWTLEGLTLEMTEPRYFPLTGYPEAWTPSTDGVLSGTPVYVGDKTLEELGTLRPSLAGAIVLMTPPQYEFITEDRVQPASAGEGIGTGAPPSPRSQGPVGRRELLAFLQDAGVGAALRPNAGQHGTIFVLGNRNTPDAATPSLVLASEHYNMLVRMVEAGQEPGVRVRVETRYHEEDTRGYNVLAEIPGTDPSVAGEIVLMGAHLDSWHSAPGGSDNADGVASTLEAMRILMALGARPRRTIMMALWGGEEEGLLGSREWVRRHLEGQENTDAREKFFVYLNNDPGYGKILGWYMENNATMKPVFDEWLGPLKDMGAIKNVMEPIGSTDHVPFIRAGVPAFNAIQEYRDYDVRTHHTNMDFYERVAGEDLEQAAMVLAWFACQAAMWDGEIPPNPGGG